MLRPQYSLPAYILPALMSVGIAFAANANELSIAVQKVPDSLDPALENSNVNQRIMWSLFNTLVTVDYRDGGKMVPGLATDWDVISPRTVEFKLREGVTFHNGDSFDAEDVAYTFSPERLQREGGSSGTTVVTKPFLGGIENVEVMDPMTVRITMKEPDAIIVQRFANYPSQILSKEGLKEADSQEDYSKHPIGTGPYRLVDYELGEHVTLEAFGNYWGEEKAAAEKVTFTVVPEVSTRIAGLRSGQFDIITEVGPDSLEQINKAPNTQSAGGPVENIRGLIYDSTNDILDDPSIRQAMNLAIDRQAIVDSLYHGRTEVPHGWQLDIFGDMFLADRSTPEYDPERARSLLDEAGYDGEEIVYRTQNAYYTNEIETAQILQSMWTEVGLNVKLDVKETWAQVMEDTEDRHIFNGSFTAYYPDPMGQFWRRFGPNGGWAQEDVFEVEPEMLRLGDTLSTSPDLEERRRVFSEMLDIFQADPDGAALHLLTQFFGVNTDRIELDPMPTLYLDLTTSGVRYQDQK
ncbi:ABC transporter substrate-binding protein [Fodinicurvata fenggangensis]|uniref:ABC transporter substrate-binding protein n=1 Tax=Fodinicurvata fenggangensis TaxID=1121830 RepID=UPI00138E492A|nr:ABC transporter substrate-binding protein [Fodinicurvata fenggangensis]